MKTSTKTNATATATATATAKMVIPSFDRSARTLISAKLAETKATVKFSATCTQVIQGFIDACVVAGMQRNVKAAKAVQAAIATNKLMLEAAKTPTGVNELTLKSYALGAAKAFYFDAKWHAKIGQLPEFKIPTKDGGEVKQYPAKTKKDAAPGKAGSVQTTNKKALLETLQKAMDQCGILNLDSIRAGILDLCIEINPKFKV